ncbi:hypothetical protein [Pseudomonas abietaniphila]|uniref:Integrase n=1 Tax=Pseudomonas abietaniphila TaxID=89065 RepID=A0A1G8PRA0_9PSED|nr:hypothetical protein [Pseudomonas abietaniphila]SDI94745.1 hypothetical protein SAMN05216605_11978 [Pseudomonas abietaniphila]
MRYLSMYRSEESATSADSIKISATYYTEHPLFSFLNALCCALHYVFIRYVPDLSYSKGYELRTAIVEFLKFREQHNARLHPSLHINKIEDIGVEEFRLFIDYLRRIGRSLYPAVRLRAALQKVAKNNDDGLPLLTIPGVGAKSDSPREPLALSTDQEFYSFMDKEVSRLIVKLLFRGKVKRAAPYSSQEIINIRDKLMSLEGEGSSAWTIDPVRAMRTLLDAGYPFGCSRPISDTLRNGLLRKKWVKRITSPEHFVLSCCLPYSYSQLRRRAPNCISYTDLMEKYYPTSEDHAALACFIQRLCGWNKESVLNLDKDRFLHPLSEVANSNVVMIVSEKRKSQSSAKRHESPKTVWATSTKKGPRSGYYLILMAKQLSEPLHEILQRSDGVPGDDVRRSSPFLCLAEDSSGWALSEPEPNIRIYSLNTTTYWNGGVAGFLERAQLYENGELIKSAIDLEGRLRVTWEYNDARNSKHPLSLIALKMGHNDIETTSTHYDSSGKAISDRKERFREIQEDVLVRFRDGKFQGTIASTGRPRPSDPTFRILTIIGHERALWACVDSSSPDFPGAEKLESGERCTKVDKCWGCKQIYLLGDSLPFLMERLSTLERAVEADDALYDECRDEISVLEYVLRNWGDETATTDALTYMRKYEALLPFDMKSLIPFVED